jgi:hypothetical protein
MMMALAIAAATAPVRADLLNPGDFSSLGALNLSGGTYTINTTTDQLLDASNNVLFTGVTSGGVSVFDFSSIALNGATINVTGGDPLGLLSRGGIGLTGGSINLTGGDGGRNSAGAGGPGSSQGGAGGSSEGRGAGIGGGSFDGSGGGFGGAGGSNLFSAGGTTYGDLATQLVGGSGGGGGNFSGGGAGGAIELSAGGTITIAGGSISAGGGAGTPAGFGGGGGSGGGIILGAPSVSLSGTDALDVVGGAGGDSTESIGGGGGGGGRILILADNSGTYSGGSSVFDLAGGSGGGGNFPGSPGGAGVLTLGVYPTVATPEPSSALAVGFAALAALGVWARSRRSVRRTCRPAVERPEYPRGDVL